MNQSYFLDYEKAMHGKVVECITLRWIFPGWTKHSVSGLLLFELYHIITRMC
jgi:hypothetical protein